MKCSVGENFREELDVQIHRTNDSSDDGLRQFPIFMFKCCRDAAAIKETERGRGGEEVVSSQTCDALNAESSFLFGLSRRNRTVLSFSYLPSSLSTPSQ